MADVTKDATPDDDDDVRPLYVYMSKVFGPAGWNEPEMDEYNALDPRTDEAIKRAAMEYVLAKNAELYRRLAK